MTNQNVLDRINEIMTSIDVNKIAITYSMLKELKLKLLEDIENSEAKKDGKDNILKGFKYILKNTENSTTHAGLHKVFKYENNYVVTDTYNILVYNGEINIKEISVSEECPNLIQHILKDFPNEQYPLNDEFIKIDIPTKTVVKNVISEQKAYNKLHHLTKKTGRPKSIYHIEDNNIGVDINAEFLLNLINLGVTELYCKGYMFYGFNADRSIKGVVCGVRKAKEM